MAILAAPPPAKNAAAPASDKTPIAAGDVRNVIVLLDHSPLHLRLNVRIGNQSLAAERAVLVSKLIADFDRDGDGRLTREEANRSPLLRIKPRPGAAQFIEQLGASAAMGPREIAQTVERLGGELVVYRQDPSAGQIDGEVFQLLDADNDKSLSAAELAAADQRLLAKDEDGDQCVSYEEFLPPLPQQQMLLADAMALPDVPTIVVSELIRDAREPFLPRRLLARYDRNKNLKLDARELGWTDERLRRFDRGGDAQLETSELSALGDGTPDAELSIDLAALVGRSLAVAQTSARRLDADDRGDHAKLAFPHAVVTFSVRVIDPVAASVENAMRQFNALDADANGYLDREETTGRTRFERGLFELIDVDGDARLFGQEMQDYVRARGEPAATTCRMNAYDTGNGFFTALDANADGRISTREIRAAQAALSQLDQNKQQGIEQNEPPKHFHIEFVRGTYQLFGPTEQIVKETPAFQQPRLTGPIWFQRMDRNNDGDLTWSEFLGPRDVFQKFDANGDGLIDAQEAAISR